MKRKTQNAKRQTRRGFSLVEVLLAIFILGIGMIMVASVFPVGADWTRQTAEESTGQTVAQDAMAVINRHYGVNGDLRSFLNPDFLTAAGAPNLLNQNSILKSTPDGPFMLQALPGSIPNIAANNLGIPPAERAYQFGSANPFPASNWQNCTYFWTALARLSPLHRNPNGAVGDATNGILLSSSYSYDLYILVFRKGAVEQQFSQLSNEISGTRDSTLMPSVTAQPWMPGAYSASRSPSVYNAMPPIGEYGIGFTTGTVFKQVADPSTNYQSAAPRPFLRGQQQNGSGITNQPPQEWVIYAPPADGTANSASPLIYIYQTTISF